jgi:hypothetical protein
VENTILEKLSGLRVALIDNLIILQAYFHDGSLFVIEHQGNSLKLMLESAEITELDRLENPSIPKDIILSELNTYKGVLVFKDIEAIIIGQKVFCGKLKMAADDNRILNLNVNQRQIEFFLEWMNYSPNYRIDGDEAYESITIKARKIDWQPLRY